MITITIALLMTTTKSTWIYDSGAIVHITNDRSLLTNL